MLFVLFDKFNVYGCYLDYYYYCWGCCFYEDIISKFLLRKVKGCLVKKWVWKLNLNGEREYFVVNFNDI